jgi:hypothetical protein
MNLNRKLSFSGLIVALLVSSLASASGAGAAGRGSNSLNIPFIEQRGPYNCGQASVQMAILEVEGIRVNQFRLEDEMRFIQRAGTRNIFMVEPFVRRGLDVRVELFSNLGRLMECVDEERVSIINIRFDPEGNSGHYGVVVGYNESGFFLHDPWPEEWGAPAGRHSGENVFISDELLLQLWGFRLFWVLSMGGEAVSSVVGEDRL